MQTLARPASPADSDSTNQYSMMDPLQLLAALRALDGPTAAARLSIAFLINKKGTHEKDRNGIKPLKN